MEIHHAKLRRKPDDPLVDVFLSCSTAVLFVMMSDEFLCCKSEAVFSSYLADMREVEQDGSTKMSNTGAAE